MRMFRSGYHYRVHVLERQQLLGVLKGARRLAVVFLIGGDGALEVVSPQVANGRDLHIFCVFEQRHNSVQFPATVSDADVPQRDPLVGSGNARVGKCRGVQCRTSRRHCGSFLQELSPVKLIV